ncbi:DUF6221 family protein [Nonomuraea polychroma]|uniref:DUF6221 family protein n=1 Tax=Nonomuraea polychroma TaxID=46176 RepID=UPI000FDD2BF1
MATGPWTAYLPDPLRLHIARYDPARVLREVEAKRCILDALASDVAQFSGGVEQQKFAERMATWAKAYAVLRLLALPYADHPDYQERWKP